MVLDEELENNNDPEKDEDTTSRFTEKFDEETGADTEMEVSPSSFLNCKVVYWDHLVELIS